MLVRTISQLPPIDNAIDTMVIASSFIEMSVPNIGIASNAAQHYTSYKISEGHLEDVMCEGISSKIQNAFSLLNNDQPVDVSAMLCAVNMISSGNQVGPSTEISSKIYGVKCFGGWVAVKHDAQDFPVSLGTDPLLSADDVSSEIEDVKYLVPNIGKVNEMMQTQPVYFSTTDSIVAEGTPLANGKLDYATTIGSGKFYFWRIDQNGNDSSDALYDTTSKTNGGYQEIADTGQLVVWGWLADGGSVNPEDAWVGLFAQFKCEGDNVSMPDIPVSIQPWIRGQYASTLQYVSFTIPVKKGLRLKVKTGFQVNDDNSGFQSNNTLTFRDRWVPNAFFGYVVK